MRKMHYVTLRVIWPHMSAYNVAELATQAISQDMSKVTASLMKQNGNWPWICEAAMKRFYTCLYAGELQASQQTGKSWYVWEHRRQNLQTTKEGNSLANTDAKTRRQQRRNSLAIGYCAQDDGTEAQAR